MKYTGAEIIIKLLERYGVEYIAGIPGGANLPLYDALSRSRIKHILARHEQGAGFIAQGIARSKGVPGICFATSGPGVMNLLTAIADAYLDSVPLIAFTGQVALPLMGTDAFQEVDAYGLTIPITKHNFLVRNAEELLKIIPEAFRIAMSGRRGPVLIDVPKNIQNETIDVCELPDFYVNESPAINTYDLITAADMINKSERPVICAGGGVISSGASGLLRSFAAKNSIPVACTLMGLGAISCNDPLYIGMLGMHGTRFTNTVINEADLFIALGARFDDRATGRARDFCPDAGIIHIDIDASEIDKIRRSSCHLSNDIGAVLEALDHATEKKERDDWHEYIAATRERYPDMRYNDPYHPANIIKSIAASADQEAIITTDVGQHQMWTAQSYPFRHPRTFLASGGLGTMGFGLPAAIGASLANPGKQVICISGDGSILMNIQELATLADLNLPVKIAVLNNRHLGLVRQQQEMFYNGNIFASRFIGNPDFAALADVFGISGMNIGKGAGIESLHNALRSEGPCLIDITIDHAYNVLPIVPPGAGNHEMVDVLPSINISAAANRLPGFSEGGGYEEHHS